MDALCPPLDDQVSTPGFQVHIPQDPATSAPRGIAYITFSQPQDALAARAALDGTVFQGRLLHILPAVGRAPRKADEAKAGTLKQQRFAARKENAGQAFSWAALYLNVSSPTRPLGFRLAHLCFAHAGRRSSRGSGRPPRCREVRPARSLVV